MMNEEILFAQINDYYYSGNIPDIRYDTSGNIGVTLELKQYDFGKSQTYTALWFSELHVPYDDKTVIRIREIIDNALYSHFDIESPFDGQNYEHQPFASGKIIIKIGNIITKNGTYICPHCLHEHQSDVNTCDDCQESITKEPDLEFYALKGNKALLPWELKEFDFKEYFEKNILTLSDDSKRVGNDKPGIIGVFPTVASKIKIQANNSSEVEYIVIPTEYLPTVVNVNIKYSKLKEIINVEYAKYVDVWMESNDGTKETNKLRLYLDTTYYEHDDDFLFQTTAGGMDTIRMTGVLSQAAEHEYLASNIHRRTVEYDVKPHTIYDKNTGVVVSQNDLKQLLDFFASNIRYHLQSGRWRRIYVIEKDATVTKNRMNSFSFKFSYDQQFTGETI